MNKLLLLAILFQKTDIATIIVLIGVVVLILVAALVSTISDGQDEKGKEFSTTQVIRIKSKICQIA